MNNEIEQLKKDIKDIRAEINELRNIFIADSEQTVNHIVGQDRAIADIFSYLMPLLRRTYPNFDDTVKQYTAILKHDRPPSGNPPRGTDSR
jgi:hypothetical protein